MTEAFWDARAPREELDEGDEAVNRALRWRVIDAHLAGVTTILDVGGGTGAYSIPLARRGYQVTHVDLSRAMLARAGARASAEGVRVELAHADAADLSRFADRQFDLVLNLDGAISFAGAGAAAVIAESCRVTGGVLIATASHKATMVATWIHYSLQAAGRILPAVHEMMQTGRWDKDALPDNALIYPSVCAIEALQAFTAPELAAILRAHDMDVLEARGLGSLTHLLLPHGGAAAVPHAELVELCARYDETVLAEGPGTFRRAGLLAVARRRKESGRSDCSSLRPK